MPQLPHLPVIGVMRTLPFDAFLTERELGAGRGGGSGARPF